MVLNSCCRLVSILGGFEDFVFYFLFQNDYEVCFDFGGGFVEGGFVFVCLVEFDGCDWYVCFINVVEYFVVVFVVVCILIDLCFVKVMLVDRYVVLCLVWVV